MTLVCILTYIGIWGVWQPQVEELFDNRVINTGAPCLPVSILDSGAIEKRIYHSVVGERRGSFTPFVLSVGKIFF